MRKRFSRNWENAYLSTKTLSFWGPKVGPRSSTVYRLTSLVQCHFATSAFYSENYSYIPFPSWIRYCITQTIVIFKLMVIEMTIYVCAI